MEKIRKMKKEEEREKNQFLKDLFFCSFYFMLTKRSKNFTTLTAIQKKKTKTKTKKTTDR